MIKNSALRSATAANGKCRNLLTHLNELPCLPKSLSPSNCSAHDAWTAVTGGNAGSCTAHGNYADLQPALNGKKALVAMSGGVDSSVAAFLAQARGLECSGAMMKLYAGDPDAVPNERGCCTYNDAADARAVAFRLNMPFYVFNFTACFEQEVIKRFVAAYQGGVTPNPCIDCNRYLKFEKFLQRARVIGKDYIVTGHYARIEYDDAGGRYLLKKSLDETKDQSYVLYSMTQEQLAMTLLPLGALSKAEVRRIAHEQGFINAAKPESQDICFVPQGKYAAFIEAYTKTRAPIGRFIDTAGRDLGAHRGITHYTVGQRRGLGLPGPEAWYVCEIKPADHTVVVGKAAELASSNLTAKKINLIACERLNGPLQAAVKIRYRQAAQTATVHQLDADTLYIEFQQPQRAVAKGQAVVIYQDDVVIGGGTIV